jgi:hypothetical protein
MNNAFRTKCLGITIDSALTWKNRIDLLVGKLSKACYVIRNMNNTCLFQH